MPSTVLTRRGRERRDRILEAAAELVAARGFHSVGVNEIGSAAGVTGAALYRHFDTKTDLLVALFDRAIDALLDGAEVVTQAAADPVVVLTALVDAHVRFALRDRALLAVYAQEIQQLPPADRQRLRRKQRRYVELWITQVARACPALDRKRTLARVEATFGLLNSVPNLSGSIPEHHLADELRTMALSAITA